jgi:murein L,D-transpeptidase YafK
MIQYCTLKYGIILKQFLLILIFINLSFANANLIDIYRQQGIKAVEKNINQTLTNSSYWDKYLKNIDTTYGYYESIQYILICTKDTKTLQLYKYNNTNNILFDYKVLIGQKEGEKEKSGDLKTPIGVYDITKRLTKVDEFYGPLALVLSYPNNFDKIHKKTGFGIWIHGVPANISRKPYTKGCIALNNQQLLNLSDKLNIKNSTIIIQETNQINISKQTISAILSQIFSWKQAWQLNDIDKYLSFYDKEFKKSNDYNITKFAKYKKRIFAKNEKKNIVFNNINIIPYPNNLDKNMFKITLYETYNSISYKFQGFKELYIELKNNKIKILYEK